MGGLRAIVRVVRAAIAVAVLVLALPAPLATAANPTYDLNGTWLLTYHSCNGGSQAGGTDEISGWNPVAGKFEVLNPATEQLNATDLRYGEESGTAITISSASDAQGEVSLTGDVAISGSSLEISVSTPCMGAGFLTATLVNGAPEGLPAPLRAKCVVPGARGKALAAAEKALAKAHCGVGKVKRAHSKQVKDGYVISESPRAGKSLPRGTKVNLVLSSG